jgi:signal transduction histidine kinase
VTLALTHALLDPPMNDLMLTGLFLLFSGGLSLALGIGFVSSHSTTFMRGIRGQLLVSVALASGLVLVNVGFTAYIMFLSAHDLKLLMLLMLFSLGIGVFFSLVVAESYHSTMGRILRGVRLMGDGQLDTRIALRTGDEMQDLAGAVNGMAQKLEESFAAQREMEDARRNLIGAVSHDLRTPLATMRAMIESINDGVVTDAETIQRYHSTMQAEIQYLSRLIDDLFELSQIDSGLLRLRPEAGSVTDLVSGALEALRPQADQRRLSLYGEIAGYIPSVLMDTPRMQRVLYNLVQNALRHTPPDGSVVVRAKDAGRDIEISVIDTGEGVEPEDLPRIFERFYRGNRARSRDEAGSGLGLTIAKGIVELHGGRIWAESERGHGASFIFTLPKVPNIALSRTA